MAIDAGGPDRTVLPPPAPRLPAARSARATRTPRRTGRRRCRWPPPQGAPNVLLIVLDDVGYGHLGCYGGPDRHAEPRQARGRRAALQQLPHHRAVFAVARRPAHRPQPPRHRPGGHHRGRHRLPRQLRQHPEERRHDRRDAEAERLQHDGARQVAPGPVHRLHGGRAVRPLAAGDGVREVLRLPRRRDRPVGAAAGPGQPRSSIRPTRRATT